MNLNGLDIDAKTLGQLGHLIGPGGGGFVLVRLKDGGIQGGAGVTHPDGAVSTSPGYMVGVLGLLYHNLVAAVGTLAGHYKADPNELMRQVVEKASESAAEKHNSSTLVDEDGLPRS